MSDSRIFVVGPDEARPARLELRPFYFLKALGADTEGRFTLRISDVRQDIYRHTHIQNDESIYLLEGEMEVLFGENSSDVYRITPGMYIYMPHGIPHAIKILSSPGVKMLVIGSPAGDEHYFEDIVERRNNLGFRDDTSDEYIEMARRNGVIYDLSALPTDRKKG